MFHARIESIFRRPFSYVRHCHLRCHDVCYALAQANAKAYFFPSPGDRPKNQWTLAAGLLKTSTSNSYIAGSNTPVADGGLERCLVRGPTAPTTGGGVPAGVV